MRYKYLIVEDELNVADGIVARMNDYEQWIQIDTCTSVQKAIEVVALHKPCFIFLDWNLVAGSGYEVLDYILMQHNYQPYILFMTGQLEHEKEILKQIVKKYKIVDEYIEKPIWRQLTASLQIYLDAAIVKMKNNKDADAFIKTIDGLQQQINVEHICCIVTHYNRRYKEIFIYNVINPFIVNWSWQECTDFLDGYNINYFITNKRKHIVTKKYIEKFDKPNVRINGFNNYKIEVVAESLKNFEQWL